MKRILSVLAVSFGIIMPSMVWAAPVGSTPDTRPATPQERKQWQNQGVNLQLSGSFLKGNIQLINAFSSASYQLKLGDHQLFFDLGNLFVQSEDKILANRLNGSALYGYDLNRYFNLYGYSSHSRDESINLNYRMTHGIGISLHELFPDLFQLGLLSVGMAAEKEWFKGDLSPFALRATLRGAFHIPLTESLVLGLDGSYTPAITDFSDYRLYGEAFLKLKLNESIAFKISLADELDSRPQTGVQSNDLGVFGALSIGFGH